MRRFPFSLGLLCFGICASAVPNSTILTPTIDTFINNILAEWNSPGGVSVAIVRMDAQGGWLVETKGYGVAKADGTKVTPDTIFGIGSNSKLFDILATGLLISNRSLTPQISWKTKVASIIPGWKLMDPVASAESTIIDLMSHRTGLPRHDYSYFVYNDPVPALIQRLKYLKPSAGFRETFQYNNMMYAVLSYLPTALLPHKPPFVRYVKEHIIDPLGMNSTTYSFATATATGRLADGFARENTNATANPLDAGTPLVLPYFFDDVDGQGNTFSGPGAVLTTAVDAARWLQMLLLNGQHPATNATIIPSAVIQMVETGVTVWDGNAEAPELSAAVYGGGQIQSSYRGHVMVEHGGDLPGYHSQITRFPVDGLGIAVLTNDDLGVGMREVIKYRLIDEVFGLDPVDWDSRFIAEIQGALAVPPGIRGPANASLPLPLRALQGSYSNRGYGKDIALCAPSDPALQCKALVAGLNSTFPKQLANADLFWTWDSFGATYMSLKHFDGALFNVSSWIGLPTGNASAPLWIADGGSLGNVAEFSVSKGKVAGFGIRGGFWGAGDVDEPQGNSAEARSEVWFTAV